MKPYVLYIVLFALGGVCLSGCGNPDFSTVTGTVTLDGQPAPEGIYVLFSPQVEGRSTSYGVTRIDGTYEMWFTRSQKGARVGENVVRLVIPYSDHLNTLEGVHIPPEYNRNSTLNFEVKPGSNTYDIAVKS